MKKFLGFISAVVIVFSSFVGFAMAHAVVNPKTANVGEFVNFSLGVPSEKPMATTKVRIIMPKGLNYVMPFVKQGWKIEVKKAGVSMKGEVLNTGEKAPDPETVTEIIWSGGNIPKEQKDQFMFSAQVPPESGSLKWMVYQTYEDGSVISWDRDPSVEQVKDQNGKSDFSKTGPYSTTQILNDLKLGAESVSEKTNKPTLALALSVAALALAVLGILKQRR